MATKRVLYSVLIPVNANQGGADYGYEGLARLLCQGYWASTYVDPIDGATISATVVVDHAQDSDGLAGLGLGIFASGGLPAEPQATVPYTLTFLGSGGVGPYTFSLHSGTLPSGLTLAGATGILSGTPDTAGPYNFVIRVTDAFGHTHNGSFSLAVSA